MAVLFALTSFAHAGSRGVAPRSSATAYPAHADAAGVDIGARLLSGDDARKALVSDVNTCCLVVEVAFYPQNDKSLSLSPNDFSLQVAGYDSGAKASSGTVVAAMLQKKAINERDVSVAPHGSVGYETGGYDPVTGSRAPGVYTESGVSIARDPRGSQTGSSERDRNVMETELNEKGLPDGDISTPVAGYLYFKLPRNKKATYQLVYQLNGEAVTLQLK
jgi:hypothetical protein